MNYAFSCDLGLKNGCSVKAKQISFASHLIDGVTGHFKQSCNMFEDARFYCGTVFEDSTGCEWFPNGCWFNLFKEQDISNHCCVLCRIMD